ncbi:sigma-54-dependent Fis family transcriptional regulator [candidate division KSB1 bacterium]|nr:sigma-54-dependent Fis family transcriptional regulator [candidate division KSB1 bacterium]
MKFFSNGLKDNPYKFDGLTGKTDAIQQVFKLIEQVARTNVTVLLLGESGTGKELVSRSIHARSARAKKPFIAVNMGAISPELVISELFGHEKGAYTGAHERKEGRFERANGGTLFMDEISTMDQRTQISLLRVLESRHIHPVGARNSIPVDVRVIGATNKDLLELVKEGQFREDLYYRFNVVTLNIPPLRERKEDIPIIANEYLRIYGKTYKKKFKPLSEEIYTRLINYHWPGNVRELKNVIHRAVVLCEDGNITARHFPGRIINEDDDNSAYMRIKVGSSLKEVEKTLIKETLFHFNGNKQETAKALKISRKSLYNKIKEHALDDMLH